MTLAAVEPELAIVDRWLERRAASGMSLAAALEGLAARRLAQWSAGASGAAVARARDALREGGHETLAASLTAPEACDPEAAPNVASSGGAAAGLVGATRARATDVLARMTGASGGDAFEVVEQAFRRSLARLGARFVATHARAAIDDDMGPMHSTVVAAELLSMLERVDPRYLEALTFALETLHDWAAVATIAPAKSQAPRARKPRALSSPKRRA